MGKPHKIARLRDADHFARILGTCEHNRFSYKLPRCAAFAEYECNDRGMCEKHARAFAKRYRLVFPGDTPPASPSAKKTLERAAKPKRPRPRGPWLPQPIDPKFVYIPESLEKVVTYYSLDMQKFVAAKAGMEALGAVLAKHLASRPGKRAIIAGWELWLVKKKTIRMRVARPGEVDPVSLFDAWEVRERTQGKDAGSEDAFTRSWLRRKKRE